MSTSSKDKYPVTRLPDWRDLKFTIQELYDMYFESPSGLNLNPIYQRDFVWTPDRKRELIESILKNRFIPKLVLNAKEVDSNTEDGTAIVHNCIDGKQRLLSIFEYINGEFGVRGEESNPRLWYFPQPTIDGFEPSVRGRKMLDAESIARFRSFSLAISVYDDLDSEAEIGIFQSLQQGQILTSAEKLYTIQSYRAEFCRNLYTEYEVMLVALCNMKHNVKHRSPFGTLGTLVSLLISYEEITGEEIPKARTGPPLSNWMEQESEVEAEEMEKATTVLDRMAKLVIEDPPMDADNLPISSSTFSSKPNFFKATTHSTATFSPIELVCTGLLAFKYASRANHLLLKDIKAMRKHMRQTFKQLLINNDTFGCAWAFIKNEMPNRIKGDYSADIPDDQNSRDDHGDTVSNLEHDGREEAQGKDGEGKPELSVPDVSMNGASDHTFKPQQSTIDASMGDATSAVSLHLSKADASMNDALPDSSMGSLSIHDESMKDASSTVLPHHSTADASMHDSIPETMGSLSIDDESMKDASSTVLPHCSTADASMNDASSSTILAPQSTADASMRDASEATQSQYQADESMRDRSSEIPLSESDSMSGVTPEPSPEPSPEPFTEFEEDDGDWSGLSMSTMLAVAIRPPPANQPRTEDDES